jgi:Ribbon-helix-helix protein, copG family
MTLTVKLEPALEGSLRQRAAALGQTTSDVVRAALQSYLAAPAAQAAAPSAYSLGAHLFGQHPHHATTAVQRADLANLAQNRKSELAQAWGRKHPRRGA